MNRDRKVLLGYTRESARPQSYPLLPFKDPGGQMNTEASNVVARQLNNSIQFNVMNKSVLSERPKGENYSRLSPTDLSFRGSRIVPPCHMTGGLSWKKYFKYSYIYLTKETQVADEAKTPLCILTGGVIAPYIQLRSIYSVIKKTVCSVIIDTVLLGRYDYTMRYCYD